MVQSVGYLLLDLFFASLIVLGGGDTSGDAARSVLPLETPPIARTL